MSDMPRWRFNAGTQQWERWPKPEEVQIIHFTPPPDCFSMGPLVHEEIDLWLGDDKLTPLQWKLMYMNTWVPWEERNRP